MQTVHTTENSTILNETIILDGYEVYGMCQYGGSLDYVIAQDAISNEVRVIRLIYNSMTAESTVLDYKKVDRDEFSSPLQGDIFVDCSYQGNYLGQSIYIIAIGGTVFTAQPSGAADITNYYFAKFSTKYNLTEYFMDQSQENTQNGGGIMEQAVGVKVDLANEMMFLAVEINKNLYNNRTVYDPGELPFADNANIAIIGFSWTHGVRVWTAVIGNEQLTDSFARMDVMGSDLLVLLNSYSTEYSSNSSQTDIYYYRIRTTNGYISTKTIFGSPSDDKVLDFQVTFGGAYILALINNPFLPHMNNDAQWQTQNQNQNLVLIWMDFWDQILDIEGYDISTVVSPYPSKLFVIRTPDHIQNFIFASSRTNDPADKNGGLYITQFDNHLMVFKQPYGCDTGCSKCDPQLVSRCVECQPGYYLFQQVCYYGSCPQSSFVQYDESLSLIHICDSCHPTCLNCTGSTKYQCNSCCMNDFCGPIYNRVPNMGQCQCPTGLVDANGICEQRCILNLKGLRQNMCYPTCPQNSYPLLQYDQPTPQIRSQFDATSETDCLTSSNHLLFNTNKKGLAVFGPTNLNSVPTELTIAFWVRPTSLGSVSYFINAFNRIQVSAQSSNNFVYFNYKTSVSSSIQPTYSGTVANRQIVLNSWNYISVSVRQYLSINIMKYEMQMAICNSNTGTVYNAGYDNSQLVVFSPFFFNTIYLGGYSDLQPLSFGGVMKEVKLFTRYHGFAQMQDELLRLYRYYSYDDAALVAYWKLNETYTVADIQYTINDYSIQENSLTFSILSDPTYPTFYYDNTIALSLCTFHDVASCQSLSYTDSVQPQVMTPKRLTSAPTFVLKDSSHVKADGDQIWFVQNNTLCLSSNILAYMTYRQGFINNFVIENTAYNPLNLIESTHYQVCYYMQAYNVTFNLFQVYVMGMPLTVDPSSLNAFITPGTHIDWMTTGGDSAYGDMIQFSSDCSFPKQTDFSMIRSNVPDYGKIYMTSFTSSGYFYFCETHVSVQESFVPYFDPIHNLQYTIITNPTVKDTAVQSVYVNQDLIHFDLVGAFADGDELAFAWSGNVPSDCNPLNFLGQIYIYNYSYWPAVWFGANSGIYGSKNYTMDQIQMCYKSNAASAPNSWFRVKKIDGNVFFIKVYAYTYTYNIKCPELQSFVPSYGSTQLYITDNTIQFNFLSQTVYPSRSQDMPSVVYGMIKIFRGAIKGDGTLVKTQNILWQQITLDDFHSPNPFQQGDLMCTNNGQCTITLSSQSSRMKAGEIYYLSFYPNSFSAKPTPTSTTRYYLFANKTLAPGQTTMYDHLFFCRSYNVYPSQAMINGQYLVVAGENLLTIQVASVENQGAIATGTFTTMTINVMLTVFNTVNTFCTANQPTATIRQSDIQQSQFIITNLNLRDCNEGDLFADIEVVRGILNNQGQFDHIRSEKLKNIQLGSIGCDPSCLSCNGTTSSNCLICSSQNAFLNQGQCLSVCPSAAPYFDFSELIFQSAIYNQMICMNQCPFGMYPDPETNQCLNCNPDCQSCNSSLIASCLSCNPVKYLYNGKCLFDCPYPHYMNNYSDYTCIQVSKPMHLQVQIQTQGYMSRIPKNTQQYLKAYINNDNGGIIVSIQWEQLEPVPDSPQINIFTLDQNGNSITNLAVVKVRMAAFNYMASDQVVKVQCTVINSIGDIAYDISEFYINSPPAMSMGGMDQLYIYNGSYKIINNYSVQNGTAPITPYMMSVNGWTFNGGSIQYKLYLMVDSVYYLITDYFTTPQIYFRFPPLSLTESVKNISLCVNALDEYNGEFPNCFVLFNIKNNLNYTQNQTLMTQYLMTLNYTNNMTNVIQAAQILNFGITIPLRAPSDPGICSLDVHCNFQGTCDSFIGRQRCVCQQGYFGSFCQYQGFELQELQEIVHSCIQTLYNIISNEFAITAHDIELIGTTLRGVLKDPDLVYDSDFELCIEMTQAVGNATIYAHSTVSQAVRQVYLDAMSYMQLKVFHSYKVAMTLPATLTPYQEVLQDNQQKRVLNQVMEDDGVMIISSVSDFPTQKQHLVGRGKSEKQFLFGGNKRNSRNLQAASSSGLISTLPGNIYSTLEDQYQDWGRRVDFSLTQFINFFLTQLNPLNPTFTYTTPTFSIYSSSNFAVNFQGMQVFVKERDVYWNIPYGIFENAQGQASNVQEVRLLAMKYTANPFFFEQNPGARVESNVTVFSFYGTNNYKIPIVLSGNNILEIKEPWNQTQGYASELLRCMYWNDTEHSFVSDDTCVYSEIWDLIPCLTCAEGEVINTTVVLCRCQHLSRFAAVYEQTAPNNGAGIPVGIYSNFFAMQYWDQSFGYFAVLACGTLFVIGHIICYFVDRRLQPKVLERLRERARKMELKGFKQKERDLQALKVSAAHSATKSSKIGSLFTKKNQKNPLKDGEEIKEGEEGSSSAVIQLKKIDDVDDGPPMAKGGKKKIPKKSKKSKLESERSTLLPMKLSQNNVDKVNKADDNLAETGKNLFTKKQKDQDNDENEVNVTDGQGEDSSSQHRVSEEAKTQEQIENEMKARYEQEQKDQGKKKVDSEDEEDNFNKDQHHFLHHEKKNREKRDFKLKRMLISGNYASSLLFVTSIISPRHTRWTLFVACICLNWFWCAVIFNNTKNPLVLPDFKKQAYNLNAADLWVSFISPFGTMILMYIFAGLFKISDSRLRQSYTSIYLELMLIELKKEMRLRFILAYFITISIFSAVFWYVIKFTASFGWQTSWEWWYAGIYAILLQFFFFDSVVNIFHWITYNCSRQLALFCMKLRVLKQARTEA